MKKVIALSTLFAISGVAVAAFQPTENAEQPQPQPAVEVQAENKAAENTTEIAKPDVKKEKKEEVKRAHGKTMMAHGKLPAGHPPVSGMHQMPKNHPQGFIDLTTLIKDSKSALEGKDRSRVLLEGNISKQVNDNEYLFVDNTGSIKVEIHHGLWRGLMITPQDKVRLEGFLDKQWEVPEIKVRSLHKIN